MDIVIRYGELALKGKNRHQFEKRLIENIKGCIGKYKKILRPRGRIIVVDTEECSNLSKVFGISSFSYAESGDFNKDKIRELIDKLPDYKTFRMSTKRIDKSINEKSMDLNIEFGQYVVDKHKKKVSLNDYDMNIFIEILEGKFYFFTKKHRGQAGLPLGTNGRAFVLIENDRSYLAAWMMMRRGIRPVPVATEEKSIDILQKFNYGFPELKLIIEKDLNMLARKKKIKAITLGQILTDIDDMDLDMLILRPLIGFSDEEIEEKFISIDKM